MQVKEKLLKRALISVYYKDDIEMIAKKLQNNGWEIVSTGGTAKYLEENNIKVIKVADITKFPEILNGRVKTLHPLIFGPILAKKNKEHIKQLEKIKTFKIDLVIVNFYPFEDALDKKEKGLDFMIENIDVGGPSMVRAAAKNFKDTIVIIDKKDYLPVVESLVINGDINIEKRKELAQKAFSYTSFYDSLIADYLLEDNQKEPDFINISGKKYLDLRYGENPHQKASLYIRDKNSPLFNFKQLQGKKLSFNNILDLSMVYEVINNFDKTKNFSVIVKHQNPCGAAIADSQKKAFEKALSCDPQSAFGGIVGFNKPLNKETAEKMRKIFFEVIIAPDYDKEALKIFNKKKNLRIIKMSMGYIENTDIKTIPGGFLVQDRDNTQTNYDKFDLKTSRALKLNEKDDAKFGWKLIKFVKSNGIIIVKNKMLIGVGAGQMSRVDSVEIAIKKSRFSLEGSTLLSDAFFPFADSIEIAAKHKISVVVEPGGSIRDKEVIKEAENNKISLLFTGIRHFKH